MNLEKYKWLIPIIEAKMWNEGAKDLSDSEIERTLGGCVMRTKLILFAKEFRYVGALNELEILAH